MRYRLAQSVVGKRIAVMTPRAAKRSVPRDRLRRGSVMIAETGASVAEGGSAVLRRYRQLRRKHGGRRK